MTLGQKIAALRTEAQLSQEALADQMGVSRQSVSKWETDASIPELDKLIQLSKFFGVTLDELVQNGSIQKSPEPVADKEEAVQDEFPYTKTDKPYIQNEQDTGTQALRLAYRLVGCVLIAAAAAMLTLSDEYTAMLLLFSLFCLICGVMCVVGKLHIARAILLLTAICLLYLLGKILFSPA